MLRKKLFRELRMNAGEFMTIFLMVMIAALAFSGVHAYMDGMEDSANAYYGKYNLEDLWLTGENFSREDLEAVKAVPNVAGAERVLSFQCTWIRGEGDVTIETNFIETNEISRFYVKEGEGFDPEKSGLWLDYYLADHLGVKVGDEIPLSYGGYTFTEKVNGLIATPDHVYSVKDPSVIFTNHTDYGFAYLSYREFPKEVMFDQILKSAEFSELLSKRGLIRAGWKIAKAAGKTPAQFLETLTESSGPDSGDASESMGEFDLSQADLDTALDLADVIAAGEASAEQKAQFFAALDPSFSTDEYCVFPQILVDCEDTDKLQETSLALENACDGVMAVTGRSVNVSWAAYQSEVEEGQTYSMMFTGMFLLIAVLSVVTTMNRFVRRQRTQIGTLKALGYRNRRIILHYVGFGFWTGLLGVVTGTIAGSLSIGNVFLAEQMDMFIVPEYSLSLRPVIFLADIGIIAAITLVTYLSCRKILREPAAQALRVERPKVKVRKNAGTAPGILKNASFAVKWNLRDIRRNRMRSLMAVAGIAGSCLLIVAAFGMRDSLQNYLRWEFGGILHFRYQLALGSDCTEEELNDLVQTYNGKTSQTLPIELYDSKGAKQTNTAVVNDAADMLRFSDHDRNYFTPEDDGIYITEKLSALTGLAEGGTVRWRILGQDEWHESLITGVNRDPQNQNMNMSRAFYESLGLEYRADHVYTNEDLSGISELPGVETISSVEDLAAQMDSMLSVMNAFIGILVAVSAILGFVIIYNLGILSLAEKNYQFATLKVLGFRFRAIRKIFVMQNIWLTVIAVILGLPAGYLMTDYIFKEAIGDQYDFFAMIEPKTYVIAMAGTLIIALASSWYLAGKLKKIDMVTSLKANE